MITKGFLLDDSLICECPYCREILEYKDTISIMQMMETGFQMHVMADCTKCTERYSFLYDKNDKEFRVAPYTHVSRLPHYTNIRNSIRHY